MSLSKLFCPKNAAIAVKRERRKEARPGELLDAALDLFVEKGFAATRVEEVAARVRIRPPFTEAVVDHHIVPEAMERALARRVARRPRRC